MRGDWKMKHMNAFTVMMILCLGLFFSGCAKKASIKLEDVPEKQKNEVTGSKTSIEIEPEYEKVSRPIKEFWIIRDGILALTEAGELYYGCPDISTPVFITSNVKEVTTSENYGLILLNDGKIIKMDHRGKFGNAIFLDESMTETPDCLDATYDVKATKIFNENLFFNEQGILMDLEGNIIFDQSFKNGYVMEYSVDAGLLNGLFLLEDGTVLHRFAKYGDIKDRIITTDVARLDLYVSSLFGGGTSYHGSVVRNNGELLVWDLDEYYYESDPLSPVLKVATNVNPEFETSFRKTRACYVDSDNTLCCWEEENAGVQKLCNNIAKIYFEEDSFASFAIDERGNLYSLQERKVLVSNVKEMIGNGRFINYLDNKCSHYAYNYSANGAYEETYRLTNVKQAKQSGLENPLQVFLKYGGALYAVRGDDETIYKTAFCEVTTNLVIDGMTIALKHPIQSKQGSYMLPYDEICSALKLMASEDKTKNGLNMEFGSDKLEFVIDETKYKLNGMECEADVAPYKDSDGLIWIPIDIVAKGFGYHYSVDLSSSCVDINISK